MVPTPTRRGLIAGALALPFLALPGCARRLGDIPGIENAIRRLLTLSSQRAFTRLAARDGFFADDVARVTLPSQLGGSAFTQALAVLLGTRAAQDRLLRIVNDAAVEGARLAAPVVYDSIRSMSFGDAVSLVRGGPTAATDFLERAMGNAIVDAMFPGVGRALRSLDNGILNQVVRTATGIDFQGLQRHVSESAARGIYRAIGREEAAIRADPGASGDPVLAGLFALRR